MDHGDETEPRRRDGTTSTRRNHGDETKYGEEARRRATTASTVEKEPRQCRRLDEARRRRHDEASEKEPRRNHDSVGDATKHGHIDSALYWIRKVKFESPTAQMENCTTTDVLFQQHLDARFQRFIKVEELFFENDKLLEYCVGAPPRLANPWIGVDKVYLPLNYESKHWVLVEIDFTARKITVYDSETYCIGPRKFERFMEPLSNLLPLLLQKIGFFSKRSEIEHGEDMTPWSVKRRDFIAALPTSKTGVPMSKNLNCNFVPLVMYANEC
ncbi:hypothetical protein Dsin_008249 [Dipteronia sinensis]|uniref:Ubiquitin-like protease family profile domain-containing protein n=1 Tax=Dipteronia sinensis TaxID=43782 RepID=A0AAE0APG3_9ROSI|nr:hypothetical protein Dsin_008249 [Dipteronia sinensis]